MEYELAAKKSLKSCTYLGSFCQTKILGACVEERESYCCYSSPLARILQEQIRPQLGMSYGDIKHPDCSGIPINRLSEVDWNKVNLDEWIAILQTTNRLPTAGNALGKLNLDKLTGQGSPQHRRQPGEHLGQECPTTCAIGCERHPQAKRVGGVGAWA